MYARYKPHDDATLCYMQDALHSIHTCKDVFLLGQAGKKAKAKANALWTELVKKQKVDEETNAELWTLSKKRRRMNAWRDHISHKIFVCMELDADFNFPKIPLMSHLVKYICRHGALQQYSAERHEQAHKRNLKDCWNASNYNLNYLPQEITLQRRILCFKIPEFTLQALAQHREHCSAWFIVLSSGADLAAPLSSQSYAKHKVIGPENRRDG